MTTITLSQSLLDTDFSSMTSTAAIFEAWAATQEDIAAVLSGEISLDGEPTYSGRNFTLKNPTFSGQLGIWSLVGAVTGTVNEAGETISGGTKTSSASIDTGSGVIKLAGTFTDSYSAKTGIYSLAQKYTEVSYRGEDGSSWSLKGTYNETYSYNKNTDTKKYSVTSSITSVTSADGDGNSVSYSGNLRLNSTTGEWLGSITTQTITIGKTKFVSSGLTLGYDDLTAGIAIESIASALPGLLAGNDVISVDASDPVSGDIYGYGGNDKITGTAESDILHGDNGEGDEADGNDTLSGGAGDDELYGGYGDDNLNGGAGDDTLNGGAGKNMLTGGKGADTFLLSTEFLDYETPKNTKITTITDFKISEGDTLEADFEYVVYKTLKAAAADDSADLVVYESSTGKFWYDDDGASGTDAQPVCFAVCVGLPIE